MNMGMGMGMYIDIDIYIYSNLYISKFWDINRGWILLLVWIAVGYGYI